MSNQFSRIERDGHVSIESHALFISLHADGERSGAGGRRVGAGHRSRSICEVCGLPPGAGRWCRRRK